MSLGWRPHDIDRAYLPFYHAVGAQTALTDPVFMRLVGVEGGPRAHDDVPAFPYDPASFDEAAAAGDARTLEMLRLGEAWMAQLAEGVYRTWDELVFVRQNWEGPLILKGILSVQVRPGPRHPGSGRSLKHPLCGCGRMRNSRWTRVRTGL